MRQTRGGAGTRDDGERRGAIRRGVCIESRSGDGGKEELEEGEGEGELEEGEGEEEKRKEDRREWNGGRWERLGFVGYDDEPPLTEGRACSRAVLVIPPPLALLFTPTPSVFPPSSPSEAPSPPEDEAGNARPHTPHRRSAGRSFSHPLHLEALGSPTRDTHECGVCGAHTEHRGALQRRHARAGLLRDRPNVRHRHARAQRSLNRLVQRALPRPGPPPSPPRSAPALRPPLLAASTT